MKNTSPIGPRPGDFSNNVPLNYAKKVAQSPPAGGQEAVNPPTVSEPPITLDTPISPTDFPAPPPAAVVTADEATALFLSPPQKTAIICLTSGATRAQAAIAAGVTRTTLYRWLNHDPNFQAAYNAWHKDLITTAQGQLLAASQEAIACVLHAIRRGDSNLAWKLLESQGLTKAGKPGSTDVAHLQQQEELDRKRAEIAEKKQINNAMHDEMMASIQ